MSIATQLFEVRKQVEVFIDKNKLLTKALKKSSKRFDKERGKLKTVKGQREELLKVLRNVGSGWPLDWRVLTSVRKIIEQSREWK